MKLTAITVEKLKPAAGRREIADDGCRGLYLVVQPSGHKSYAVRYRAAGKPRKLTLAPGLSLGEARAAAAAAMAAVEKGVDPSAVKRTQTRERKEAQAVAEANTVRAITENYWKREGKRLRSLHWQQLVLKRHVFGEIGDVPIGEVRRSRIVALLDKIEDRSGPTMADMVLSLIRPIFLWHSQRNEDYTSPIIKGMGRIRKHEHARARVLDDDELKRFWETAERRADTFSDFVRFLLLTGARREEARELVWGEIKDGCWTLPAARNKVKVDLLRPLSKAALAIIESRTRIADSPYVFTTTGTAPFGSISHGKATFDAEAGVTGYVLHDLRRTSRTLLSRAGVTADIAEMCVGHVIRGVRGVYDRYAYTEEKRVAYERLAQLIENIVHPPAGGNVVNFAAAGGA
jgi:integrase